MKLTNWQRYLIPANPGCRHKKVYSVHWANLRIRLSVLSALLTGTVMATLLLLGGSPVQALPTAHAQGVMDIECPSEVGGENLTFVEAIPRSPGAKARYVVEFVNGGTALQAGQDGIVLRLDPRIQLPQEIKASEIDIHYEFDPDPNVEGDEGFGSGSASSVEVRSPARRAGPATVTIFPKIMDDEKQQPIPAGASVEVVIKENAGISNPVEGGAYLWEIGTTHDESTFCVTHHPDVAVRNAFRRMEEAIDGQADEADFSGLLIDFQVEVGEHTVRRGDELVLTARGFAVGTTVIFWRDSNMNGVFDGPGAVLCRAEADSQAIARCSIPVTNPPFVPGFGDCTLKLKYSHEVENTLMAGKVDLEYGKSDCNFINARDGHGHTSILLLEGETASDAEIVYEVKDDFQVVELAGTVNLGSMHRTHSTVRVELLDFPQGHLESIRIGGFRVDLEGLSNRQIPETGRLSLPLVLPGNVLTGLQNIAITVGENPGDCAEGTAIQDRTNCHEHNSNVEVDNSLYVEVSPSTALPNQSVRVTVQGFQGTEIDRISMDGVELPASRIGGQKDDPYQLDNSSRWVGSVDLPVNGSTLLGGERKLQVRDSEHRLGEAVVIFPARTIRVSPEQAGPGDTITISGEGFPVSSIRNSEDRVEVTYDHGSGQFTTPVSIDSAGRFSTEITVPRAVEMPSSNLVSAEFVDDEGHVIYTKALHQVREATLAVYPNHGPPGSTVMVTGSGLRPFTPVTMAIIGGVDVTPSPAPHTDRNGMMEFEIMVPQSEAGTESILVLAGGIYVLADFQVSKPLMETGPVTAIKELSAKLGDNFLAGFHFANDTKTWTFYDPLIQEESDLEFLIPGEVYFIQVSENTEAVLNGRTHNLSCREDSCWNQIAW